MGCGRSILGWFRPQAVLLRGDLTRVILEDDLILFVVKNSWIMCNEWAMVGSLVNL